MKYIHLEGMGEISLKPHNFNVFSFGFNFLPYAAASL